MKDLIPKSALRQIDTNCYEIPKSFHSKMQVPARIFVNNNMLDQILQDESLSQIINVSMLPGIQKFALAMPDIHEGYGFPIGGVAAMAINEDGVISPGGIGYDINCGVRLLTSELLISDLGSLLPKACEKIHQAVPTGAGRGGLLKLNHEQLDRYLTMGAKQAVKDGYGTAADLEHCEEKGCFSGADAAAVSIRAKDRGNDQLGTLGSGNHFLEIQVVDKIYNNSIASVFGLYEGQVSIMIHCGSRGLGHQVCTDYVAQMLATQSALIKSLPDRQLACAPFLSNIGQAYFGAMKASANYAFANRHIIGDQVRRVWAELFGPHGSIKTLYDVCHNVGKLEYHEIANEKKQLIVHRKGATRSFGPGNDAICQSYQKVGQPVIIPGTMGTYSYVLAGLNSGFKKSFASCCHGAGRAMSRMKAKKSIDGHALKNQLNAAGIFVSSDSARGLAEEAPQAYKNINDVIDVVTASGLAQCVARLRPIGVIKGD
jgi:tRNA-splicing ligase RtcB